MASDAPTTVEQAPPAPAETRPRPKEKTKPKDKPKTKQPPPWNVVLLDDDDHSYDYVMRMMMDLFCKSLEASFMMACEVDATGRVICETTHKERAEFKRDQILAYGKDKLLARCAGSMSAIIEPADVGGGGRDDE